MIDFLITILFLIFILYLLAKQHEQPKTLEQFVGSGALVQLYAKSPLDTYLTSDVSYYYPYYINYLWMNDYLFDPYFLTN